MKLSAALIHVFQSAATTALKLTRSTWGLPEYMIAALDEESGHEELWEGLIKNDEHRDALIKHFTQASSAVAAQEAGEQGDDEPVELTPELQSLLEQAELLAPPPDDLIRQLLLSWQRDRDEDELDADDFLHLVLYNWKQLYPVPLEKLGIELEREGEGEQHFLRALFSQDQDLNHRFGSDPMQGLLNYPDYCRSAMEVLVRRYRQNLLMYGLPGSGKSTVLRRLIEDTAAGRVPQIFAGKRFFEFDHEIFLRDLQSSQDLAKRFAMLQGFLEQHTEIIMVVDGIQHLLGSGNTMLQEFLQRLLGMLKLKKLHFVLLADVDFYNRVYKGNPQFEEWMSPLYIKSLGRGEAVQILASVKERFEEQYGIELTESQLEQVVEMADEHIRGMQFPKKALILLDVALSILALEEGTCPPSWESVLRTALARITGKRDDRFPDRKEKLQHLEEALQARIVGQDNAIAEVCRTIRFMKSDLDLNPERPDGVFLFAGPSGVGKQLFATELSRLVYGNEPFLVELSEFQEAESLQRIVGRFGGQEEGYPTHSLLDRLRSDPRRVLILKNIEFAAGEVLSYFLKGFEEGMLRDASGQQLPVADMTVVLLSDLIGMEHKSSIGFQQGGADLPAGASLEALREYFSPGLLSNVDKLVVFQPLSEADLLEILQERIVPAFKEKLNRLGHELLLDEGVAEWLAHRTGGRNASAKLVDKGFEEQVAERINEEILAAEGHALNIRVQLNGDAIQFKVEQRAAK